MKWNPCLDMCRFSFLWSKLSFGSFKPKQNLSQFYWVTEGRGSLWPPLTQLSVGLSFSSSLCCTAFWDDCTAPAPPPRLSHADPVSDELQLTLRVCYLLSPFSNFSVALVNNKSTWFSSRNISFFPLAYQTISQGPNVPVLIHRIWQRKEIWESRFSKGQDRAQHEQCVPRCFVWGPSDANPKVISAVTHQCLLSTKHQYGAHDLECFL